MTPAQRTAIYGSGNPNAPQATSQTSERQAQAKQAELAREKQHQDALNSDTVAVDFSQPLTERPSPAPIAGEDHHAAKPGTDTRRSLSRKTQPSTNTTSTATTADCTGSSRAVSSRES